MTLIRGGFPGVDLPGCNSPKMRGQGLSVLMLESSWQQQEPALTCSGNWGLLWAARHPRGSQGGLAALRTELPLLSNAASGAGSNLDCADDQAKHFAVQCFHSLPAKQDEIHHKALWRHWAHCHALWGSASIIHSQKGSATDGSEWYPPWSYTLWMRPQKCLLKIF